MKTERFSLASAADVAVFDTLVKVIRFDEGNAGGLPVIIKVKSLSGGAYEVELKPGRMITLPEVTRGVVISNLSGGALAGKITIGAGMVDDNAVVGEVSIVDGGKARTLAGRAFIASINATPSAGIVQSAVLWNPVGSGKYIIASATRYSSNTGQAYGFEHVTSIGAGMTDDTAASLVPKVIGAAGISKIYVNGAANFNGASAAFNSLVTATVAANTPDLYRFDEPVIIKPGYGVRMFNTAVTANMKGAIELIEEDQ